MMIRSAQITDAPSIAVLSVEVWTGTYLKRGIGAFFADYVLGEFTSAKTNALIHDPWQHMWVAVAEDGIVGVLRLTSDACGPVAECSDWEIATLYVQPRHHGKGYGTHLLKKAFSYAKSNDAPSVWLATNAENTPAIQFYLAQGFKHIGETHFRIADEAYLNNVYGYTL
ncbi:GNAT family N-acetyltransferase [uncultured Sulfitobacter sp.]|uniref:GNAT family N-acetyltransferase n=1 Tax=uncultured Sulfitobacter sp. TaxID=191468 RepID=UPI00262B2C17|nr:GNAT family N-acetyltransferase [uncultured Sulfitobacter sp.]